MLSTTPIGEGFPVNDFIVGDQTTRGAEQAIAVSPVNQVAVFAGKGPVDRDGVFAKVYDTEGETVLSSFRVNTTRRGVQSAPAVAVDGDGNFIVAWSGRGLGDRHGIFFQRFDSAGLPIGEEMRANGTTGGWQTDPSIAVAFDGSFAIAWSGAGDGDASGVFLQRYDLDGNSISDETRVSREIDDHQTDPNIAFDTAGNLIALWSSRHQDDSDLGVFGQRFDPSGDRLGTEFQVNTTTASSQSSPMAAATPTGGFYAAWSSYDQDGDGWGVVAREFAADGSAIGDEMLLNSTAAGHQRNPSVAVATDGQLVASWEHGEPNTAGWEIHLRTFSDDGIADGESQVVNGGSAGPNSGHQQSPAVALHHDNAVIVWSNDRGLDHGDVFGQRYEIIEDGPGVPQQAPDLAPIDDGVAIAGALFEVTVTATDPNVRDRLTFSLDPDNSPATAVLEQLGNGRAMIRWTPTAADVGSPADFRVIVTDDGDPVLTDTEEFQVTTRAADLVGFAQAVAASGARLYGAGWCEVCTTQKELFEDGGQFLPFVEVTNPDRTPNQIAEDEDIEVHPTWIFADGTRLEGEQTLQTISERSGVDIPVSDQPFIAPLTDETLLIGSPLLVPLDGYDPNGGPLTYQVTTNHTGVTAEVFTGNRSARIDVAGFGDIVFELFENLAPRATDRIIELANDDFYRDIIFHRILNNQFVQGGDPEGDGTGGSTLGEFDDQYHPDLQHNRVGLLSMAKRTDDTNDSQFFITDGTVRHLDFNHTIFGVHVEGAANRDAISNMYAPGTKPEVDIVMEGIEIFDDQENAVVLLRADSGASGIAEVTVTVTDTDGNSFERTFEVDIRPDIFDPSSNSPPFLGDIAPVSVLRNMKAEIQLTATDVEDDPVFFGAERSGDVAYTFTVSETGLLEVTPPLDFVGTLEIVATVGKSAVTADDHQLITIQFV